MNTTRSLLASVLVLCGVKPHRLDRALAAICGDDDDLTQLQQQFAVDLTSSSSSHGDDEQHHHPLYIKIAQVVADDILKKSKRKPAVSLPPSSSARVSPENNIEPPPPGIGNNTIINNTNNEHGEELPVLRVARSIEIYSRRRTLIVLCSGATGTGKSALSAQLASRLGIQSVLSTDSVREALRANPAAVAATPALEFSSFESQSTSSSSSTPTSSARDIVRHFEEQCGAVLKVVERYLESVIARGDSVIVEGVHLLPRWVRGFVQRKTATNNNTTTAQSHTPIFVPVFAFVGGTARHMRRFAWRRSRAVVPPASMQEEEVAARSTEAEQDEEEEEEEEDNENTMKMTISPPSLSAGDNRYVDNFERIRLLHNWLLSEVGKCFVHADIFFDDTSSDDGGGQHDDHQADTAVRDHWRRNANAVVKLIRSAHQQNVTSALTPILDNVNLDRSVNFAHRAVQMWLDAADIEVACAGALPPEPVSIQHQFHDEHEQQQHHHHHDCFLRHESVSVLIDGQSPTAEQQRQQLLHQHEPERMLLDKWDDTPLKRSDVNGGLTIAEFLQRRRKERSRRGGKEREDDAGDDDENNNNNNRRAAAAAMARLLDGGGSSSGDDACCGGSVAETHASQ